MRKMTVLGASALLVAGLMASPAAAFAAPIAGAPAAITGDGERLDDQVCKDYDSGKIEAEENAGEVYVEAPEGQLISGYCVKAGSKNQDEGEGGAYFVELDEPAASWTITYPWGGGRDISHYALVYTDASTVPSQEPTPEPTVPGEEPTDEPTKPGEEPTGEPTKPGEEPTGEPTDEPTKPGDEPTGEPTDDTTTEPGEPGDEPTTDVTEPAGESAAPAEDDATPSPSASAEAPGVLASTGASTVIGFTLIALALVGGGVTLIVLRRKGVLGS
ncbi:hypothetical protein [Promicromonospora umidemergens]|uniref:LPXTG-motif cell wall-anchored protein n=1 Tax=Promicromonospora umidemergens TaxID=629679 RepID=A0ABP8WCX7_9MICO|nr:hypothetical protein [Promicromonospora umidemergens]